MKDKKDLRNNTKSTKYLLIVAKVVGVLTALVFFVTLTYGTVNASISREISNQYQDKQLDVLKKNINQSSLNFIGKLINVSSGNVVNQGNVDDYQKLIHQIKQRISRKKAVADLYNGKKNYQDDITKKLLDKLDQQLLKETNQDVYQTEKNKLDTIRIWFEQTHDAQKYIQTSWDKFNNDNSAISLKRISMINTYFRLIKNKTIKNNLNDEVTQMNQHFNQHSGDNSKLKNAEAQLAALKNSSLKEKYKPANVEIISDLQKSSKVTSELNDAGVSEKHVLYYDTSKEQLGYMTLSDGKYTPDGASVFVISGNISSGQYSIKSIINSAGDNAAIVTDHGSSDYGKYLANATTSSLQDLGITDADNTTADYNNATPVFWLKNNPSLTNSIYFGDSSTIGFIYSGSGNYNNSIQISASGLSTIESEISTGTLLYVK